MRRILPRLCGSLLSALLTLLFFQTHSQDIQPYGTPTTKIKAIYEDMNTQVPPPEGFEYGGERDVVISVTYTGFTAAAQTAFQYAVDIWASTLTSDVPIMVDAYWEDIGGGTLGYAGATNGFANFSGAPMSNTWYPSALADKLAGFDINPGFFDIEAHFDSGTNWYFGTDGNPGFSQFDFVSVVLHELGHGLGFSGSADYAGGFGYIGFGGDPDIYDVFVENGGGTSILNYGDGTMSLGTQLTGGNLYFSGTGTNAANGGNPAELYAPGTWSGGSSYSHLDENAFPAGNANSLMTPFIGQNEAVHSPGAITVGMLEDIGWDAEVVQGDDCIITDVQFSVGPCTGNDPAIVMFFDIAGLGCIINEICTSADGGPFECEDIAFLETGDGGGIQFNAAVADTDYEFYFVMSDGSISSSWFYNNGNCSDFICDCSGTEHTLGVLDWLGDGFPDDSQYEWEGQIVDFDCETWGYDCGDIDGAPDLDPWNVCGGGLPPDNGCGGGEIFGCTDPFALNYNPLATIDDGSCIYDNGGCTNVTVSVFTDCWGEETGWTLTDGLGNVVASATAGTLGDLILYEDNLCLEDDCYTFEITDAFGDGLFGSQYIECDFDGFYEISDEFGNILVSMPFVDFGFGTSHDFCINNDGGECTINSIDVQLDGCGGITDDMRFYFDYEGDCFVFEICAESTFDAQLWCFDLSLNGLESGDDWGITGLDQGLWNFWYTLSDGTVSPVGNLFIDSCVASEGCTNPYATNYDPDAEIDDGSCIYLENICDCEGNEHTIGVLIWLGDGVYDDGGFDWDGVPVFFDCDTWGFDCGDGGITNDPWGVCDGNLPPNNGCEDTGDCVINGINIYPNGCGDNGVEDMQYMFDFTGDCIVQEICIVDDINGDFCADLSDANLGSGDVWGWANFGEPGEYQFYYTLSDGTTSPIGTLNLEDCFQIEGCTNPYAANYDPDADVDDGSCIYLESICDCEGNQHTIGVLVWLGDGVLDDGGFDWDGVPVFFDCETWGYDCGDGGITDDPNGVCDGNLPPNNGCEEGDIFGCTDPVALNYNPDATIDDGSCIYDEGCAPTDIVIEPRDCQDFGGELLPSIEMLFSIDGDCLVDEFCVSEAGGPFECTPLQDLDIFIADGDLLFYNGMTPYTVYEFYYTLDDGTVSESFFFVTDDCLDEEQICDCAGNQHSIGVTGWLGDGTLDDGSFLWLGVPVDFDCETWGYDCGDGGITDDPWGVCDGNLPPNNGCDESGCAPLELSISQFPCLWNEEAQLLLPTIEFLFDINGDCQVIDFCFQADGGGFTCFNLPDLDIDIFDGDGLFLNNTTPDAYYEFYYVTDDGSISPVFGWQNGNCDSEEEICDCAGTVHTIGVLTWLGDTFLDDGSFEWNGQPVDFDCETWGYDCGDGGVIDDPWGVCEGNLPPNNGCVSEVLGCTDPAAINHDPAATVDDGSCYYEEILGCTDPDALNYNPFATLDDGSCVYDMNEGCTDPDACNYDPDAETDDGSCEYESCAGCTDGEACNYDPGAWIDDGSCDYDCYGCTDEEACNYDPDATEDDGSCDYSCYGCTDPTATNYDPDATIDDGSCIYDDIEGCTDPNACNYDEFANVEDGSCEYITCAGCTDDEACNYDPDATIDDGSCDYECYGCTDPDATNYDPDATIDDGSCIYGPIDGCTDPDACNYDEFATDDDGSCEYETCAGCTDDTALNYDPDATLDDGSCIYDCEFPTITYTTFCEDGDGDNFYIEMDIDDLGNGAPYLVSNNATAEEIELTFEGIIELGPFANDDQVVISVESLFLIGCNITSSVLTDNCTGDNIGDNDTVELMVMPNPNNGQFVLSTSLEGMMQLRVFDLAGKLVWQDLRVAQPNNLINLGDVATGTYVLTVQANDQVEQVKLVID